MNLYNRTLHKDALLRRKAIRGMVKSGIKVKAISKILKVSTQRVYELIKEDKK
jgi:transposase